MPKNNPVQAGFRTTTIEMEQFLIFPSSPSQTTLFSLRVSLYVLRIVLKRAKEAAERLERNRTSEAEVEKARKQKALLGFEEDHKIVRQARAAKAKQEEDQQAASHHDLTESDSRNNLEAPSPLPPRYNDVVGGGRLLGTGQVVEPYLPPGVGVSNQDLEDVDGDYTDRD
ncbi:hypothetical protein OIV83_004577 [Microbotryomycetes sp. JL201]|nr:hypothetical protein OIV83_004577 [Microbotryomycetes sp. JL201]